MSIVRPAAKLPQPIEQIHRNKVKDYTFELACQKRNNNFPLSDKIICHYTNHTPNFQILRITNILHWFLERSVVPRGSIVFEAYQGAQLEVHEGTMMSSILSDTIPCDRLVQTRYSSIKRAERVKRRA